MSPSTFLLLFLQALVLACAQVNLIRDYFIGRNVGTVVGFVCNDLDLGFQIIRTLSGAGISASIKPPGSKFDFARLMNVSAWKLGVFLDLRCPEQNGTGIFYDSSEHRMYDDMYNWLVLSPDLDGGLLALNDSAFGVVTDFVVAVPASEPLERYELYDVYNHCKKCGGTLEVVRFGSWRDGRGLNVTLRQGKIERRWNFRGITVRMKAVVRSKPGDVSLIDYLEDETTMPIDSLSRFGYSLLRYLPQMFNMSAQVTAFTHWDESDAQGPLMRALRDNAVDLGYFPTTITQIRLGYARVIAPVWPLRTCFMFRSTPSTKIKAETILRPLAPSTWYSIAIFVGIALAFFALMSKVENYDNNEPRRSDFFILVMSSLCLQGFPVVSEHLASRIAFLQIMIFGLLIYNYYSAAIVSARLYDPYEKMNDSLYSLVHSNLKLASDRIIYFGFLIANPNHDVQHFKNFWYKHVPERERFISKEDGLQRAARGGFAYHADPNEAYPYINRYFDELMICQLTEVHLFKPTLLAFWASRDGQFLEISKIGVLRMMSAGLRVRQLWHWQTRKPHCRRDVISVEGITIYEAAPIILILIFGLILALGILVAEKLVFRATRHRLRRYRRPRVKLRNLKTFQEPVPRLFGKTPTLDLRTL